MESPIRYRQVLMAHCKPAFGALSLRSMLQSCTSFHSTANLPQLTYRGLQGIMDKQSEKFDGRVISKIWPRDVD
jgi:hypothetical protein